jgi:kynurenine formamidase
VDPDGARYLGDLGVRLVGADTAAFEQVPGAKHLEVHAELLVARGIPIVENLNLVPLAATGVARFLFVMAPLRLGGATGCPVNPLALLP